MQQSEVRRCYCGLQCKVRTCTKGENKGLMFFGCPRYKSQVDSGCGYFDWVDRVRNEVVKLRRDLGTLESKIDDLRTLESKIDKVFLYVRVCLVVIMFVAVLKCI